MFLIVVHTSHRVPEPNYKNCHMYNRTIDVNQWWSMWRRPSAGTPHRKIWTKNRHCASLKVIPTKALGNVIHLPVCPIGAPRIAIYRSRHRWSSVAVTIRKTIIPRPIFPHYLYGNARKNEAAIKTTNRGVRFVLSECDFTPQQDYCRSFFVTMLRLQPRPIGISILQYSKLSTPTRWGLWAIAVVVFQWSQRWRSDRPSTILAPTQ